MATASPSTKPPTHASWVNQVDLFFSILQMQCLRDGSLGWVKELRTALLDFIAFGTGNRRIPFGGHSPAIRYNPGSSFERPLERCAMKTRKRSSKNKPTVREAELLCGAIRSSGDYAHVTVRAQRGHLNVYAGDEEPVARLTPLGAGRYGLSFRNHSGRWEPMPFAGNMQEMTQSLVSALGMYLERRDFSDRKSDSDH